VLAIARSRDRGSAFGQGDPAHGIAEVWGESSSSCRTKRRAPQPRCYPSRLKMRIGIIVEETDPELAARRLWGVAVVASLKRRARR
jgi:hypothetical protein